jgi:PAS domain S-box-containing protein
MKIAEHGPDLASLQELVDSVPALIHTARPDGYIDFFNQRWLEYVGLRFEDLEGWKWTAAIHPDDVSALVAKWRACIASGEPFELESRVRRADGAYRWMWHQKLPLRNAGGEIVKWYGSSVDIDDRKRADEERTEAEFYLAEGQRLGHTGSWAFNAAGFDYWSPELFAIYGLDPGGKPPTTAEYMALVHPGDRGFVAQEIQRMLSDRRGFDFTKRIVRPDGDVRYVRCVGAPLIESGRPQTIVGTTIDVTEHELLTEQLRRSEGFLLEAQRLSHTGSWRHDLSTGAVTTSPEMLRMWGVRPEEDSSAIEFWFDRIHPDDRLRVQGAFADSEREKRDYEANYRILLPDGAVRYHHSVGHAVVNESGDLSEFVGTAMDVTEQWQIRAQLEKANRALHEREAALLEAQRLTHAGSWRHDLSLGTVTVTPEVHRIFAISPDEDASTADFFFNRIHPEDRLAEIDNYAKAQQTKGLPIGLSHCPAGRIGQTSPQHRSPRLERVRRDHGVRRNDDRCDGAS